MTAIHEKLRTMRENEGLRHGQGLTQTFISKVETGERNLTVDQLENVVNLYAAFADMVDDALPIQAQDVNREDLRSIADIGQIAMNSRFMEKELEGDELESWAMASLRRGACLEGRMRPQKFGSNNKREETYPAGQVSSAFQASYLP